MPRDAVPVEAVLPARVGRETVRGQLPILDFDRDLHVEARTVVAHSPQPQNAFEVAVVLETAGYDDSAARALGSTDVMELARRVYDVVDLYATTSAAVPRVAAPAPAPPWTKARREYRTISVALLARCLLYAVPWLAAIAALAVSRVSFWSTITTIYFSSSISLALFVALVVTGGFLQAFARRGTFYMLQGNRALLGWATRWTLGLGALVTAAVFVGLYFLLEDGLRMYTPAATSAFLWFGLSISAMLLSLGPLFMTRAFGSVALAAGSGAAFVAVGGEWITHGQFVYPYAAMHVQLAAIWLVVVLAVALDLVALGKVGRPDGERVHPPRLAAAAGSVGSYAAYGACFFLLIVVDQLVAGGLWHGQFLYDNRYEIAVDVALLVLVPTLTYAAAVNEVFASTVRDAFARHAVADAGALRAEMARFYRRHLGILVAVGVVSAGVLLVFGFEAADLVTLTASVPRVYGLFAGAIVAYLLLAVGALNSGLLFSVGRPAPSAVAAGAGALASVLLGGLLATWWQVSWGAVTGLLVGTGLFATLTTRAAWGVFERFDASYYGAF